MTSTRCNTDRNTVEIKVRGAFSLHEPNRRPCRAAEGTPSLTIRAVGVANITARMDVTAGSQRGNTDPTWWIDELHILAASAV